MTENAKKIDLTKIIDGHYSAVVGINGPVSIIRSGMVWVASSRRVELARESSLAAVVNLLAEIA